MNYWCPACGDRCEVGDPWHKCGRCLAWRLAPGDCVECDQPPTGYERWAIFLRRGNFTSDGDDCVAHIRHAGAESDTYIFDFSTYRKVPPERALEYKRQQLERETRALEAEKIVRGLKNMKVIDYTKIYEKTVSVDDDLLDKLKEERSWLPFNSKKLYRELDNKLVLKTPADKVYYGGTIAPSGPSVGTQWFDSNTGTALVWDGVTWVGTNSGFSAGSGLTLIGSGFAGSYATLMPWVVPQAPSPVPEPKPVKPVRPVESTGPRKFDFGV